MMARVRRASNLRMISVGVIGLLASAMLTGCIMVGHSSGGGWFIWPGGLGLVLMVLLVLFIARRR